MTRRPDADSFTLRAATLDDAADLLEWRNDAVTRAMSRNTAAISDADHRRWLACTLDDPARLLLIGCVAGGKVGMARFDRLARDSWEVNINVAPAHRGKGWSHALLAAALEVVVVAHRPASIVAEIKPDNVPSSRLFEAHGFHRIGRFGGVNRFVLSCDG
jgi:RimJ/RimL family protein N-acetyltransferase